MTFVDTEAWFASIVPWDENYPAASNWLSQNPDSLVTTDFIVDEILTLLRIRKEFSRALVLGDQLFTKQLAHLVFLEEPDIRKSWELFQKFSDKEWSFTDCTSKVIMEKLGIATAFSFDRHFRQFGTVIVVP